MMRRKILCLFCNLFFWRHNFSCFNLTIARTRCNAYRCLTSIHGIISIAVTIRVTFAIIACGGSWCQIVRGIVKGNSFMLLLKFESCGFWLSFILSMLLLLMLMMRRLIVDCFALLSLSEVDGIWLIGQFSDSQIVQIKHKHEARPFLSIEKIRRQSIASDKCVQR